MGKKVEQAKLDEFFQEVKDGQHQEQVDQAVLQEDSNHSHQAEAKPYQCPKCHKLLSTRKEPCKYCHYDGYIPMGDAEIKKTRAVMFVIILVIAVVVYILTR
jgi:uncharacterized paraquat-inducible protein A